MKCRKCGGTATIELRRHNAAFCADDFVEFFRNQVREAIRRHRMFTREERVLVAVSGGKDSLALWDVLIDEGYDKQVTRRPPCSGCGLSKRYLMNRTALEVGLPVVATGHNLDDEAATLFGSVMHWQTDALPRQSPALASTHPKLVRRVKPLYRLSERETAAYAFLRRIDYIVEECPFAAGATSIAHKEILNRMEDASPGAKHNFLFGFLEKARPAFERAESHVLQECARCGQVTTSTVCAFCKLADQVKRASLDADARGAR
jgi:tRNA-5-methyluridine54 2-sulfurtransferase